jgi:hypothetical protein
MATARRNPKAWNEGIDASQLRIAAFESILYRLSRFELHLVGKLCHSTMSLCNIP